MDFIPLIFTCGCQTKYKDEHDGSVRVCPRCHNPSIAAVKQTDIFEFCYIPLIPYSSSHLWQCSICQWNCSREGPAPPLAGGPPQQPQMQPQMQQGYPPK